MLPVYTLVLIVMLCQPAGLLAMPTAAPTGVATGIETQTAVPTETPTATPSPPPVADSSSDDSGGGLHGNVGAVIIINAVFIALSSLSVLIYTWHITCNAGEKPSGCLVGIGEAFLFLPHIVFLQLRKLGCLLTGISLLLPLCVMILAIVVAANGNADILALDLLAFILLGIILYDSVHVTGYSELKVYESRDLLICCVGCWIVTLAFLIFIIPGTRWEDGKTEVALGTTIVIALLYGVPPALGMQKVWQEVVARIYQSEQ